MKTKLKNVLFSLLLILISVSYIILHFFRINLHELFFYNIINSFLFILFICFLFVFIINIIIKNIYKTSIIVSIYVILFFSYYYIYDCIQSRRLFGFVWGRERYLLPLFALVYFILFLVSKTFTKKTFNYLFIFISVLLIYEILLILPNIYNSKNLNLSLQEINNKNNYNQIDIKFDYNLVKNKPDIYYIIFDAYGRRDTILKEYNFDNIEFLSKLEELGFYVAHNSVSNYSHTALSIPSTFNMNFLNFLTDVKSSKSRSYRPLIDLFENNIVSEILSNLDYYYIHIATHTPITNRNTFQDEHHYFGFLSAFSIFLWNLTPLRTLI